MLKQILQKYPEICKGKDLIKDIEFCSSGIIRKILIGLIGNNKGSKRWEGNNSFFCENIYDEFTNGACANIEIFSKRWDLQFCKESIMTIIEIIKRDYHNLFLQFYHLVNSLLLKSIRV